MTTIDWQQRAREINLNIRDFISGEYRDRSQSNTIKKYSPRDGSLLYEIPNGTPQDMEFAIDTSKQAYEDKRWRNLPLHHRQSVLRKLAELIESHMETFALYESLDAGKPITQALGEVLQAAMILREAAENSDKLFTQYLSDSAYCAYQIYKPVGVVGAIISWNYPLVVCALKVGPALIMGNSLVLKPSEYSSLSAGFLAALALEAGVPSGILNVVHGAGDTVGSVLANHREVGLLSFTGSSSTGKKMQIAAGHSNMKRLLLECGGKSPYVVFDDCSDDLDNLAADIVNTAFHNQGQNCLSGSRLLVQNSVKDKLLPKIIAQAAELIPQDPLNPNTTFGAMIHEAHMNKVLGYIESAKQEGARLVLGGNQIQVDTGSPNSHGFYIEPTIFDQVSHPQHKIAREEVFGPVLSVFTFDDEQEAIQLANSTCYGLAAYVATENMGRAQRLVEEINAGYIQIIGTSTPMACYREIGMEGHRESGIGVERGLQGLKSYCVSTMVHQWT